MNFEICSRFLNTDYCLKSQSWAARESAAWLVGIHPGVRITYNENSNVIMTVTGGASQLRGSETFLNGQLFSGYRPVGPSRNSACLKIINEQKQIKLSENSMGS